MLSVGPDVRPPIYMHHLDPDTGKWSWDVGENPPSEEIPGSEPTCPSKRRSHGKANEIFGYIEPRVRRHWPEGGNIPRCGSTSRTTQPLIFTNL